MLSMTDTRQNLLVLVGKKTCEIPLMIINIAFQDINIFIILSIIKHVHTMFRMQLQFFFR
jgi:hypothetical protein